MLQRKAAEKSWLDALWDTVGDVVESVGEKLETAWDLASYPSCEEPVARPDAAGWLENKGLRAIRNGKGLLSKTKVPSGGDRGATALVKQALAAWGCATYGLDLLPKAGTAGKLGAEGAAAVKQVQLLAGLTADGIIGRKTLAALDAFVVAPEPEGAEVDGGLLRTLPETGGFSDEEERWIGEVWALPEIQGLFGLYPSIPAPILSRVATIESWDEPGTDAAAAGIAREGGEMLEIGDTTYDKEGWNASGSREALFKSVLIHELFHHFEYWSEDVDAGALKIMTPAALVVAMQTPAAVKRKPYEFGWFIHPTDGGWWHFQWDRLRMLEDQQNHLAKGSELELVMSDPRAWERSPDARNPEEDVSTCLGLYLTSKQGREHLATAYPRRYSLLAGYFAGVMLKAERAAGIPAKKPAP